MNSEPGSWPSIRIGDCCEILDHLRVPINSEDRSVMRGEIPYYGANGVQDYIDDFIFDEPLILLAEDGGYFDEFENRPIAYRIEGKSWVNNHAHVLRIRQGSDRSQDFVFYCLEHKNILPFIKGGTRAKLNQAELREIVIPDPPPRHQRRIAEILSTVDEGIEHTEALIAKTQQIKTGLMHDLFTRGVTPDGRLRPPRDQVPEIYKQSPLGWIPREWNVRPVAACASDTLGSTTIGPFGSDLVAKDYRSQGVPVIFVRDIGEVGFQWKSGVFVTLEKADELSAHQVRPGDVIATKMGAPPCVGCVYPNWMPPGVITADIIRVRPDPNAFDPAWLAGALNDEFSRRQVQAITAGVTRPKITLADFRRILLACPSKEEQMIISRRLDATSALSGLQSACTEKLRRQKAG